MTLSCCEDGAFKASCPGWVETKVDLFRTSNQFEQAPAIVTTMEPDPYVVEMDIAQAEETTEGTPP